MIVSIASVVTTVGNVAILTDSVIVSAVIAGVMVIFIVVISAIRISY